MSLSPELYEAIMRIVDQRVGEIKVIREDFDKLTEALSELSRRVSELSGIMQAVAEAQKRTETNLSMLGERVTRLESALERLAEAQKRTEERLTGLVEAQKRTEERLNELVEAQKRTEERLSGLVEAQKRTEERLTGLVEAQKRTEQALGELAEAQKRTEQAVGRLSDAIGYGLEDIARIMLPPWLERHERVRVDELERRIMQIDGESIELNLYGDGLKGRRPVTVIGEAKSRIHTGDVKEFATKLEKAKKALKGRTILPVMFAYWIHPAASSLGRTLGVRLVASYQR